MSNVLLVVGAVAFIASLVDTSLGMCYGTILAPVLLLSGYDPVTTVSSVLFSQLVCSRFSELLL